MCELWNIVNIFFNVYQLVLIAYAILSYLPDVRGPWVDALGRLVEPVLIPLRRVIPPLGGFDLSFLALLIIIQVVQRMIIVPELSKCIA